MQLRCPIKSKDDCHRLLLQAIVDLMIRRAKQGASTKIIKVKSHIGIHGNEMADQLANEAAEECRRGRNFDHDVSQLHAEPFKDRFWLQRKVQATNETGTHTTYEPLRDLHDDLKQQMHAKHRLGQSNQESIYYKAWKAVLPYRDPKHSDSFRTTSGVSEAAVVTIDKCRTGTLGNNKRLFMMGKLPHKKCPLCKHDDSIGHIMGACAHPDLRKQYIARHDKAARMLVQAFIKGKQGGHYLIADIGTAEGLKEIGVHSKRVPSFVLPDSRVRAGADQYGDCRDLTRRDLCRDKMRPDIMIVEMTEAEQHLYLHHGANSRHTLSDLPANMPNGSPRKVSIVEVGYCSDTRYLEKIQQKEEQHSALETALRSYGYEVAILTYILGLYGSLYHSNKKTMKAIGIEHAAADRLSSKTHVHSVNCAHNLNKARRFLESRVGRGQQKLRADPP